MSRNIANIALGLGYNGSPLKSPTPEPRNDGSFDKCWKRINGITYLYKSGGEKWSDNTGNESYSEVLVNQVAYALGLPLNSFVRYECIEKFVDNKKFIICRCPSFTSEDIGYLPIENTGLASADIMTQYKTMLKCNSGVQFLAMLLLDSLTMNVDRHTGNYGFLFSTDNLKIIKMAPIFDNNLALIPKVSIKDKEALAYNIRNARPSGDHFGDFIEQGKFVLSIQPKFRERLNYINNLRFRIDNGMESLSIDRLKLLEALVKRQASLILK